MIQLEGSCHCKAVRFSVMSRTPVPYQHCYCSICRKTAGAGGSAINIMGEAETLKVTGKRHLGVYQAKGLWGDPEQVSSAQRHFCKRCGSALYLFDPSWPQWVYPHASAIDTPLPMPKERTHILLDSKPDWVRVPKGKTEICYAEYPEGSIESWHAARGLLQDGANLVTRCGSSNSINHNMSIS